MATVAIKGSIFDGSEYYDDGVVVVDDSTGLISDCGKSSDVQIPSDVQRAITGDGYTILPGLIDCHVHFFGSTHYDLMEWVATPDALVALRSVGDLRKLLHAGFTTVRDLGSKVGTFLAKAVNEGVLEGPRIISAGKSLAQTGGDDDPKILPIDIAQQLSYSYYCDGPWECRKAVRLCVRDGAEVIKVYASGSFAQGGTPKRQLTTEELSAIVDEAHAVGIKVTAHCYGETALSNAIEAGVDSIEHGIGLTAEIAARIKKKGIYYIPTLTPFLLSRPTTNKVRDMLIKRHLTQDMELAKEAQLVIANGSDFIGADEELHGQNYLEIVNVAKYFGAKQALTAATQNAAECLGLNDIGRIHKGMEADLVVVKGNPLQNIELLAPSNIQHVVKSGHVHTHKMG
jgi:imidazolonepropionase-like amidohydrolase